MRCGFIALIGRPNVGKSTLMNALVGAKLAGVSDKAQTTRNKIAGIWIEDEAQLVFLDTPGLHNDEGRPELNRLMMREAWQSIADADFAIFLVDGGAGVTDTDKEFLAQVKAKAKKPIYVAISKADTFKKETFSDVVATVRSELAQFMGDHIQEFSPFLISAKKPEDIRKIREELAPKVPEGPWMYDGEQLTDRSQKFIVSEYVREQLFRLLGDELPYGAGVIVEHIDFSASPVHVMADIYVERESQKRIVIGKGGQKIKTIGKNARAAIENLFDDRVYLELFVKVKPGWVDKRNLIAEISDLLDSGD